MECGTIVGWDDELHRMLGFERQALFGGAIEIVEGGFLPWGYAVMVKEVGGQRHRDTLLAVREVGDDEDTEAVPLAHEGILSLHSVSVRR